MLELSNKDFKVAVIKMLYQAIINALEITGKLEIEVLKRTKWKLQN